MPVFLSDPSSTTYLVLAAVVIVAAAVAARWQDRRRVAAFVAAVLLLVGVVLLDRFFASPREEAVASIGSLLDAVNARDTNRFLGNVSDSFDARGVKKAGLGQAVEVASRFDVKVAAWNFDRNRVVYHDGEPPTVDIVFDAKVEGPGITGAKHVKATFVRDPDGKYRMRTFTTYNLVQKQVEEEIPGLRNSR